MIKSDCIDFPLDRPCRLHKEKGADCSSCTAYVPFSVSGKNRILIIKLGAMGDVLRTTFLLSGLKSLCPDCRITWLVDPSSSDIVKNNPLLDAVWPLDNEIFKRLMIEKFSMVINLDLSAESLALATIAYADTKIGFWLNDKRQIVCSNNSAQQWLLMSSSDPAKKTNRNSYQYWMSKIVGLPRSDYEISVPLLPASLARARAFARKHKLGKRKVVGINPGSGKRWKLKKWTDRGFAELIRRLNKKGVIVLLFGGAQEKELIAKLLKRTGRRAISTGTDNSIADFFALISLCDVVVTGDTLGLHAALGLKKKVLAVFGPTSPAEIEMYGRGKKIVSPVPCVCCYNPACTRLPTCMDQISIDTIWDAVQSLLKE